jgi:hypothetical protein
MEGTLTALRLKFLAKVEPQLLQEEVLQAQASSAIPLPSLQRYHSQQKTNSPHIMNF